MVSAHRHNSSLVIFMDSKWICETKTCCHEKFVPLSNALDHANAPDHLRCFCEQVSYASPVLKRHLRTVSFIHFYTNMYRCQSDHHLLWIPRWIFERECCNRKHIHFLKFHHNRFHHHRKCCRNSIVYHRNRKCNMDSNGNRCRSFLYAYQFCMRKRNGVYDQKNFLRNTSACSGKRQLCKRSDFKLWIGGKRNKR